MSPLTLKCRYGWLDSSRSIRRGETLVSPQTLEEFLAKLRVSPISTVERVARNIASARITAGKSVQDVAARAGMKVDDLTSIEEGARRPNGTELVNIAEALGVLVDRFFIGV
jgi:ribosome-binding protein aMBF1 (putative translation factor)